MSECWPVHSNRTSQPSVCGQDDDAFKHRTYIITYLLLFPIAILSNTGALAVLFWKSWHRSSAFSVVMMNLALSDACFSLTLPLRLAYYFNRGIWVFPDWLCRVCVFGFYLNLYTSIIFLTLLSMLRWIGVVQPLRPRIKPVRMLLVCVGVWLFVGVASALFLCNGVTQRGGSPRCFEPPDTSSWGRVFILNYVALAAGFLLPFLIIILCYSCIMRHLMASTGLQSSNFSSREPHRNRRHSVHMITMVIATFIVCFLPYHAVRTLHLHAICFGWSCGFMLALQRAVVVTLCLAASNSVVNPLLYYYSTRSFRDSLRDAQTSLLTSNGSRRLSMPQLALTERRRET